LGEPARATERTLQGTILWEREFPRGYPHGCLRLPNAHTFLATEWRLEEVGSDGRNVYSHDVLKRSIPRVDYVHYEFGGHIICLSKLERTRVEVAPRTGMQLRRVPLPDFVGTDCNLTLMADGRLLATFQDSGEIKDLNANGELREWAIPKPVGA